MNTSLWFYTLIISQEPAIQYYIAQGENSVEIKEPTGLSCTM